jgi:glucose/mannose-6-phosphate isomerase
MDLNDSQAFKSIDTQDMLGEIENLPAQLEHAWALSQSLPLALIPGGEGSRPFKQVLICGMGGSAIGADLLAAVIAADCRIPVVVHRDYGLPAWAKGEDTLVIASSHSGNTEETLDSFQAALANQCQMVVITTGGKLAVLASGVGIPVWQFTHPGQPRAAVGFSFGLLLGLFSRLKLIPEPAANLAGTVAAMRLQQASLQAEVHVTGNPAKRLAGQLVGRWVNVFGSGSLAPVARRWKTQLNELAKAGASFELIPEADHNALAGLVNPPDLLPHTKTLFLQAPSDHPRNQLRIELTRREFMLEGMDTDLIEASGDSPLAHAWTCLHFGDYLAYYLAMAYGVDPTPVAALESFKAAMKSAQ